MSVGTDDVHQRRHDAEEQITITKSIYHGPHDGPDVPPKGVTEVGTSEATKARAGKAPVFWGVIGRFPRAFREIAKISADGTKKHNVPINDMSYTKLPIEQYDDAVGRHQTGLVIEGPINLDPRDGMHHHRGHLAWNALAALEIELLAEEKARQASVVTVVQDALVTPKPGAVTTVLPSKKWEDHLSRLISQELNAYPVGAAMSTRKLAELIHAAWKKEANEITGVEPIEAALRLEAIGHSQYSVPGFCWVSLGPNAEPVARPA